MFKLSARRQSPALCLLAAAIPLLFAASAHADSKLPEPRSLIDKHVAALGGEAMLRAQTHGTMSGSLSMPAANLTGTLVVANRSDSERVTVVDLPGFGEMLSGVRGELVWSVDPFTGPRILEGEERSMFLEAMNPAASLRDERFVSKLETVELSELGGQSCYRVRIQWQSGSESFDCYGVDSGLLVGMQLTMRSPMGEMPLTILVKDYKEINGVKLATRSEQTVMGQTQIVTIESIDTGAPDAKLFELPAAIKALNEAGNGE